MVTTVGSRVRKVGAGRAGLPKASRLERRDPQRVVGDEQANVPRRDRDGVDGTSRSSRLELDLRRHAGDRGSDFIGAKHRTQRPPCSGLAQRISQRDARCDRSVALRHGKRHSGVRHRAPGGIGDLHDYRGRQRNADRPGLAEGGCRGERRRPVRSAARQAHRRRQRPYKTSPMRSTVPRSEYSSN